MSILLGQNCKSSDGKNYVMLPELLVGVQPPPGSTQLCPPGMIHQGVASASGPQVSCKDSNNKVWITSGGLCPPETSPTLLVSLSPLNVWAFPAEWAQLWEAVGQGVGISNASGVQVGQFSISFDANSNPIFDISITDPTIEGEININTDSITDWELNPDGLILRESSGNESVKITLGWDSTSSRLTFLLEVREHQGICSRTILTVFIESDPITIIPSPAALKRLEAMKAFDLKK